ncbi:MAG: hypothetical protein K2J74_06660 [Muribaculaceae bacterium]|nr:hypothetical protein [Muribaculaceae bacterium]
MTDLQQRARIIDNCVAFCLIILLVTAFLPLIQVHWSGARYLFAIGAVGAFVARCFERPAKDATLRVKRLYRMAKVSTLCYVVSAFFMFYPYAEARDWLAFLTAGAVLQVYVSIMLSRIESRNAK